jgi:regulator of protease activity HflC (stomatin/prohibitin superfamily)
MFKEKPYGVLPGIPMLILGILGVLAFVGLVITAANTQSPVLAIATGGLLLASIFTFAGLFVVNPNEAAVLQLFGDYKGSVRREGMAWANPFLTKRKVSTKVQSFESQRLKVNDLDGNPVEIAAIIVWNVVDTAEAVFQVENYEKFVQVQSEAALRNLAMRFPYDQHDDQHISLRGHTEAVAGHLKGEVQAVLNQAGVEIMDARISHLAYAPEIAQAMLQRQQAGAIIAARTRIVEGAVGMVEMALEKLEQNQSVKLDEERKAAMVSNLLVVLCGERGAQAVVNAGTLYH